MIPKHIVDRVIESAEIEEVVSDFVTLKRRGANYIANCPFHNEKTPSFSVSPSKGIYKCFGCGKAGNSVKFVMEHESMTYPDALRYLAGKYNIEIEEIVDDKGREEQLERDSLYIINQFALQHFQHNLLATEEGKSIGLSYFKERGFREHTIQKFELGYSLGSFEALIKAARAKGHNIELLKRLGLVRTKNERPYDFFRNRVQFPIHNLSGKVIAFAGRTLKKDKKTPKYVNSPETEIYVKSRVLYGMFHAKKSIREKDTCLLVEGYTDVISLHQAGIENVVASSGTSLTYDQIRLIKRYTPNITVLFDGDEAGIKAALRGIDLILEAGMNVKVVLLPDGEDPDSFIQQKGKTDFEAYIKEVGKDFVLFKTDLLIKEAGDDPVKKSGLIRDVIQTLTKIPDPIKRSLYVRECSRLLEVEERLIVNETNRLKWKNINQQQKVDSRKKPIEAKAVKGSPNDAPTISEGIIQQYQQQEVKEPIRETKEHVCERELARVLLEYGPQEIEVDIPVAAYIIHETENFPFQNELHQQMLQLNRQFLEAGQVLTSDFFITHENEALSQAAATLICSPYQLSENWSSMHEILITDAVMNFKTEVFELINRYKLYQVNRMMEENLGVLKTATTMDEIMELQTKHVQFIQAQKQLVELLNIGLKF